VPRQDCHRTLPEKAPIALRVSGSAKTAIAIKIKVGHTSCIGGQGKPMRVGSASCSKRIRKGVQRAVFEIIVETLKDEDIGVRLRHGLQDGHDLRIIASDQITQQNTGAVAGQFSVEGGDPDGLSQRR